jgi:spermidine/putrescine transport system permease protein
MATTTLSRGGTGDAPVRRPSKGAPSWLAPAATIGLPVAVLGAFVVLPLLLVVVYSFYSLDEMSGLMQEDFSTANYREVLTSGIYRQVFWRTFQIAGAATLIALLLAYPMGYALGALVDARRQGLLLLLVIIPFWTSYIVRTYSWIGILRRDGFLDDVFGWLPGVPDDLLYSRAAVLIGFVHVFLPLMILPIYASVRNLDRRLLEAAHDLGSPPWRTFLRVTLPLTLPGVVAGVVLFFIPCFGSFVTPQLLGGTGDLMMGNVIANQFGEAFNWPLGAALSVVMTLVVIAGLAVFFRFADVDQVYG